MDYAQEMRRNGLRIAFPAERLPPDIFSRSKDADTPIEAIDRYLRHISTKTLEQYHGCIRLRICILTGESRLAGLEAPAFWDPPPSFTIGGER